MIRDPIHDIIPFENTPCDRLLLGLINTAEFQRLRRIKQLGMSEMVFPGANHSRFAHSLGVMSMARRFLTRLERESGDSLTEEQKTAVLAASLLHDVGHGPFSHTFEQVTQESHEARTVEIIRDSSTELHQRLREFDRQFPETLAAFFDEDLEEDRRDSLIPPYLTQVVTSQMDADRFDYLLRDSFATGTQYGRFDAPWLLQHLHLDGQKRRFYLSHKGLMAGEAYVLARYHMYRTVYFHKTTRAAEVMLRLLFRRFRELLGTVRVKAKVVPDCPPAVVEAFSGSGPRMSLGNYLLLDDLAVIEFLKRCKQAKDAVLKTLGGDLLDRRLFKAVEATDAAPVNVGQFTTEATVAVRRAGLDPDFFFVPDTPGDTAYKPYDPDADRPATQIYVQTTLGEIKELSTQCPALERLRAPYSLLRYYFPETIRIPIDSLARTRLHGGKKP
jgi:HD superfamily phosphohydrolase